MKLLFSSLFLFTAAINSAQEPIYFVDSLEVESDYLRKIAPKEVAIVTVYKNDNAIAILGDRAKVGIIYVETKVLAKKRFWKLLSTKSADYKKTFPTINSDKNVAYILNGEVKAENFEGDLASTKPEDIKTVTILNKQQLKKDYGISNKEYGVKVDFVVRKKNDKN